MTTPNLCSQYLKIPKGFYDDLNFKIEADLEDQEDSFCPDCYERSKEKDV